MTEEARLDEFDKDEWFDISKRLRPDYTEEQFALDWDEFVRLKQEHQRVVALQ